MRCYAVTANLYNQVKTLKKRGSQSDPLSVQCRIIRITSNLTAEERLLGLQKRCSQEERA